MPEINVYINDLELNIEGTVKQHLCRTASVRDRFMEMRRDDTKLEGLLNSLEIQLATAAGKSRDNHTIYEVTTAEGNHLYIMFKDMFVYFGLSIEEERW